ncbi:MAG: hypothetical protein L6Q57_04955 [Alphaproteobacteria bacterium]|nr:hypothetical protein [Alphaproteobacteria bacterium]
MRFLVFALILSIFVSGYVTAAHAFAPVSEGKGQIASMAFCNDCQPNNTDSGDQDNDDQFNNGGCMACHHCCSGHVAFPPAAGFNPIPTNQVMTPALVSNLTGDHTFSLLRPPKSFV